MFANSRGGKFRCQMYAIRWPSICKINFTPASAVLRPPAFGKVGAILHYTKLTLHHEFAMEAPKSCCSPTFCRLLYYSALNPFAVNCSHSSQTNVETRHRRRKFICNFHKIIENKSRPIVLDVLEIKIKGGWDRILKY